jgi:hypothetical protein
MPIEYSPDLGQMRRRRKRGKIPREEERKKINVFLLLLNFLALIQIFYTFSNLFCKKVPFASRGFLMAVIIFNWF